MNHGDGTLSLTGCLQDALLLLLSCLVVGSRPPASELFLQDCEVAVAHPPSASPICVRRREAGGGWSSFPVLTLGDRMLCPRRSPANLPLCEHLPIFHIFHHSKPHPLLTYESHSNREWLSLSAIRLYFIVQPQAPGRVVSGFLILALMGNNLSIRMKCLWAIFLPLVLHTNFHNYLGQHLVLPPLSVRLFHRFVKNYFLPPVRWISARMESASGTSSFSHLPSSFLPFRPLPDTLVSSCSPSPGGGQEYVFALYPAGAKVTPYHQG